VKKYKFKVYFFNTQTREVDLVATCTTKPTTQKRAHELAKLECLKAEREGGAVYEMVTK
jgi:hypothetical protein